LKIIVCLKEVVHPLRIGSRMIVAETPELDCQGLKTMMNPYDAVAIEKALVIREKYKNGKITLLTAGPDSAENILRRGLAMGCDKAVRVWDNGFLGSDSFVFAQILGRAVEKIGFDLIFCGYRSIDGGSSQMPAMLAEALGLSFVSGAVDIKLDPSARQLEVWRKLERGDREKLLCPLPAVVSIEEGGGRPRYPTLPGILKSKRADIGLINKKDLEMSDAEIGIRAALTQIEAYAPPRPKTKKFSTPDSSLSASERLKLLMSGGLQDRGGDTLEGSSEKIAMSFVKFLADESIIMKSEDKN
jgi:electron transfer flavoprotein beta subunit